MSFWTDNCLRNQTHIFDSRIFSQASMLPLRSIGSGGIFFVSFDEIQKLRDHVETSVVENTIQASANSLKSENSFHPTEVMPSTVTTTLYSALSPFKSCTIRNPAIETHTWVIRFILELGVGSNERHDTGAWLFSKTNIVLQVSVSWNFEVDAARDKQASNFGEWLSVSVLLFECKDDEDCADWDLQESVVPDDSSSSNVESQNNP